MTNLNINRSKREINMNIKLISTPLRLNNAHLAFMGNMSQADIEAWSDPESFRTYANLQDLRIDLTDVDEKTGKNFLHYVLSHDNPAIYDELKFRLDMLDKSTLENLLNQADKFGKTPLDYCPNLELRIRCSELFNSVLGKQFVPSIDYNTAVRAAFMPGEQIYPPQGTVANQNTVPQADTVAQVSQADTSQIAGSPQAAGNELSQGDTIPSVGDLDMSFDDVPAEETVPVTNDAVSQASAEPANIDTSENVPKVNDTDFEFDNYKKDLAESANKDGENEPKGLDDVVGHENIKALLRKNLIEPLKKENLDKLDNNNLKIENGFLFYGPPGCGKTYMVKALANELNMEMEEISDIMALETIQNNARKDFKAKKQFKLVFIDNIDEKISNKSIDTTADVISKCAENGVILFAATNKYDDLDSRFTAESSCFNQIIEVPLPAYNDRILVIKSVLDKCQKDLNNQITDDDIQVLAKSTSGFSNAAITYVVEKGIKEEVINGNGVLDISDIKREIEEFAKARKIGKLMDDNPTSVYDTYLKRSIIEYPKSFDDVAGMRELKETLRKAIVKRLDPEIQKDFKANNTALFNDGFLFYGPPGCGKTFIVEALAGESKLPLYKLDKSVYGSALKDEGIKNIVRVFKQLEDKYKVTGEPSILFIDEADSILPKRRNSGGFSIEETNTFLQYLHNSTKKGIIPILATNFKDNLDEASVRTGRIGTFIEVPTPDFEARKELFRLNIQGKPIAKNITNENIIELANMLEGFASSDIVHIAKETIDAALVDRVTSLTVDDFKKSIKTFAKERSLSTDFSVNDRTAKYDTIIKREVIKYPRNFSDVAGMGNTKEELRKAIVNKLHPEIQKQYKENNVPLFDTGFMLYGKSGNGKTFIVNALAGESGLPLYKITKADYGSSLKDEAGIKINNIFKQLQRKFEETGEYSLLFFDEADAIFPKRGTTSGLNDEETNLMLQLLLNAPERGIIPILATNFSEKIDPAIINSHRVGKHIEIPAPDFEARKAMFEQQIKGKKITKHITDDDIASLARMVNGFCAADITRLSISTIENAINAGKDDLTVDDFKEAIKNFSHERNLPEVNDLNVTSSYDKVLKRVQIKPKDPHSLDEIGGMKEAKEALYESIIVANDPEIKALNEENGIEAPNGILLYGPPGCGKTYIMKAVASEAKLPLYQMKMSEMGSKYINETSSNIKSVFEQLKNKFEKTGEPSLLFLDECDSFFSSNTGLGGNSERNQDLNTLKEEMNNAGRNGIIIVAATNEIQNINPAILRDGRFDTKIKIDFPDADARFDIIQKDLRKHKLTEALADDADGIKQLVDISDGMATVSIVTAITDLLRRVIANKKKNSCEIKITIDAIAKAIKEKVLMNEKLKSDIAERALRISV